jgi:hypothetical protein
LLRYFRLNDPYRLVGLLVLLLILYLPLLIDPPEITFPELKNIIIGEKLNEDLSMYTALTDNTAPLAAWFSETVNTLTGRSLLARHILAFALIFLQAAFFGIMLIARKSFNESTYIPSLIFCLLFFISYDLFALSEELVGLTFILLALNNLFMEIEFRVQRDETVFNLGLFISLASLFSFPYFVFLLCVMAILLFFSRTSPRKFLLLIFGFLLPHLLIISVAYLNNSLSKLWSCYYADNLGLYRQTFISFTGLITLSALPLIYFVVSVFMLQREARFSKYQSTLLQVMFLWLGFCFLYLMLCKNLRPQNLIVFIPPLTFMFTHFFLFIRRRRYAEMNIWILLVCILSTGYLSRYNKISLVSYAELTVPRPEEQSAPQGKRILVLENNIGYLRQNRLATPYLNWKLSERIFRNPEYYETVTEVYHALKHDPPDVIIDRENLMKPFLERMPEMHKKYVRTGDFYNRITINN